jgi:hypothetical protein
LLGLCAGSCQALSVWENQLIFFVYDPLFLSAHASASAVAPPLPPLRADGVAAPAVPGDAAAALGAAA